MPGKVALVEYEKCHPAQCDHGVCAAAVACPRKLLKQETPFEAPMPHPSLCRGCGDCVRACPAKAVQVIAM